VYLSSIIKTIATKNGNAGILYLTNAPKFAEANPTENMKIITNKKENIRIGSENKN